MTLLETFNAYLDRLYEEPMRKGVAKGEKIGNFWSTHKALNYALYNFSEKEKAKRAEISYAFLRKLRCSDSFKEDVYGRRVIFIEDCLFMYLHKGHFYKHTASPGDTDYFKIEVDEESAFDDASLYDEETKEVIVDWLIESIEKDGYFSDSCEINMDNTGQMNRVLDLLKKWNEPNLNKKIYMVIVKVYSEKIDKLLKHKNVTDENHKDARRYTNLIFKFSETL